VTAASSFPLSARVAVAGSRHGSPWSPVPLVGAVLAAGGQLVVGCAPGVDQSVRLADPGAVVLRARELFPDLPPAAAFARRTRAVVRMADQLAVFPAAEGLGPGSALALDTALELSRPVWLAGPCLPAGLPPVATGSGWQPLALAGVAGWLWLPSQPLLF
jgi:hypothetical protein